MVPMANAQDPLGDLKWSELPFGNLPDFRDVMVQLVAHAPDLEPHVIGSGFRVTAEGHEAIALTAAHVIENARGVQTRRRSHPTTPPEYRYRDFGAARLAG
jgi:hypothetical protein